MEDVKELAKLSKKITTKIAKINNTLDEDNLPLFKKFNGLKKNLNTFQEMLIKGQKNYETHAQIKSEKNKTESSSLQERLKQGMNNVVSYWSSNKDEVSLAFANLNQQQKDFEKQIGLLSQKNSDFIQQKVEAYSRLLNTKQDETSNIDIKSIQKSLSQFSDYLAIEPESDTGIKQMVNTISNYMTGSGRDLNQTIARLNEKIQLIETDKNLSLNKEKVTLHVENQGPENILKNIKKGIKNPTIDPLETFAAQFKQFEEKIKEARDALKTESSPKKTKNVSDKLEKLEKKSQKYLETIKEQNTKQIEEFIQQLEELSQEINTLCTTIKKGLETQKSFEIEIFESLTFQRGIFSATLLIFEAFLKKFLQHASLFKLSDKESEESVAFSNSLKKLQEQKKQYEEEHTQFSSSEPYKEAKENIIQAELQTIQTELMEIAQQLSQTETQPSVTQLTRLKEKLKIHLDFINTLPKIGRVQGGIKRAKTYIGQAQGFFFGNENDINLEENESRVRKGDLRTEIERLIRNIDVLLLNQNKEKSDNIQPQTEHPKTTSSYVSSFVSSWNPFSKETPSTEKNTPENN